MDTLTKLEKQNRRLKRAVIAFLVALSAAVLMGQAARISRIVTAQKVVLKDAYGNVLGWGE